MKSQLFDYTGDNISTDTTGAGAFQELGLELKSKSYRLVESLVFAYENSDGTFTAENGLVRLLYETATGKNDIPLFSCSTLKNSMIPLINGTCDEGLGRIISGRTPVIVNPNDYLSVQVSGFPAGKVLQIRGRYWESDTIDEILQYK